MEASGLMKPRRFFRMVCPEKMEWAVVSGL
jgi:hypothetical protein